MNLNEILQKIVESDILSARDYVTNLENINVLDKNGCNLLHLLASCEDMEIIDMLIDAGINIDEHKKLQMTPLFTALMAQNRKLAEHLIEKGANVTIVCWRKMTALKVALLRRYDEVVRSILERGGDPNDPIVERDPPIYTLAFEDDYHYLEMFLEHGADVNIQYNNATLLMLATLKRKYDLMGILMDYGADIQLTYKDGRTAIDIAKDNKDIEGLKILLNGMKKQANLATEKEV